LEGNEEAINAYSDDVLISQKRFAVRLTGMLDEQKNAYDMRQDAKEKLSMRMQEFIERQFFLKLAGVGHASLTDVNGTVISADYAWSNTGNAVPAADSAAGYGARYLCADYTNGADSLATTDVLTPDLISRARVKASLASPKIQPLKIDGKNFYLMFVHPWQAYDLKINATYAQAQREAAVRGEKNPIFTGALGVWDGVIVHEHEYVPFLDISVVGHNFAATAAGTDFSADCFRALLVGRQAGVFAKSKYSDMKGWVEKTFDYDNQTGFATRLIGGIQKLTFNSKDYGVVCVDTSASALV
jgi:N4-gp56 family major capsid protein